MRELLRITMSEAQVKEACREFAEARTSVMEPCTLSVEFPGAVSPDDGVRAEVVFTKKRVRTNSPTSKEQTQ